LCFNYIYFNYPVVYILEHVAGGTTLDCSQ